MSASRDRVILAAVVYVVLLAQVLLYPGIDTLVAALGASTRLDASMWFLAAEFAAFVAFAGPWGAVSDAAGRRVPFIAAGAVAGALGYGVLAALPRFVQLPFGAVLALRALQGAATIGAFSLAMTMLMDLSGGHGRNMGAAGIAIGLGTAMGAPIGGRLYEIAPIAPLIAAGGLLLCTAGLTVLVEDRAPPEGREGALEVLRGVRETPALGIPYAYGFIDRMTAGFFALVGTLYFRTVFELGPGATGITLALFFAPFALLQYPFGILSDRVGRAVPIIAGSTLYGIGVLAVGFAPSLLTAQVAMVAIGVLGALMAPATLALVTDLATEGERGIAMAGFNIAGSLGFLVGILVGGTVAGAAGYPAAFAVAGGLEVAIALFTLPKLRGLEIRRTTTFVGRE